MRKTREELIKTYSYWNEDGHDIVETLYGDIPHIIYNKKWYDWYCTLDGTLSNIEAVEAYIYTQNGEYKYYDTLEGSVAISSIDDRILYGDFDCHMYGTTYNIYINMMYGNEGMSILNNRMNGKSNIYGWRNKDGLHSSCRKVNTYEIDKDRIEKVLNYNISDYGNSIHRFFNLAKELYKKDTENHIKEGCFEL